MNAELQSFVMEMCLWMLLGAMIGIAIRWGRPDWARRWTKFVLNRQWKLFALGAVFFGTGAIFLWWDGQVYYAITSLALFILEIVALVMYGFKPLTPEMERKIDQA